MLTNENIIVFSSVDWGHVPTSKKFISSILAKNNNVLYVETLGSRSPGLKVIHFRRIIKRLFNWLGGVKRVSLNEGGIISVYSPVALPGWVPFAGLINFWLIRRKLKKLAGQLGLSDPILWFYLPLALNLFDYLNPKLIIYHCVDEWSTYPGGTNPAFLKAEENLLKKADIVFAASKPLLEKKKKLNPNTYYLPHGSDFEHFNNLSSSNTQNLPDEFKEIKHPIIGIVGHVAIWIAWDLVKYIAKIHPDYSIIFLGEISYNIDISPMKKIKNVYFFGRKNRAILPSFYEGIDVCIIPFCLTEHTKYCQPTRLYEHLAAGKPIVATDFPAAREIEQGFVKIGKNKEEFVRLIEESFVENNPDLTAKRKKIARANTWEHRVERISELITAHLKD